MRRVNIAAPDFTYDPEDPDGFRSGSLGLAAQLGGARVGASVYELPQGQAVCPYHYEYGEEEWMLVLEGRPTVRHPEGSDELAPWDMVCFPVGPDGAHRVRNDSTETVRVLMFSEVAFPTVTVYPDSDKVGVYTPGRRDDVVVRRSSSVGYFDGEPR